MRLEKEVKDTMKRLIEYIEVLFRSYRYSDYDIKVMSKKGYRIYDAGIGRFVKE
jgi:hypothetical protein